MIYLGYLEGYDKTCEPKFNNKQAQQDYFMNLVTYTIDAYYPPFFTNKIKLDITTVPQTSPINFVILVHNNEYYYYFIDGFVYVNEDIYYINISLDTILTYNFDIVIKNGNLQRESIKRMINYQINREYIPENVSQGSFYINDLTNYNAPKFMQVLSTFDYAPWQSGQVQHDIPLRFGMNLNADLLSGLYNYLFYLPNTDDLVNGTTVNLYRNNILVQTKHYSLGQYAEFLISHYDLNSTKYLRFIDFDYFNSIIVNETAENNTRIIDIYIDTNYVNGHLVDLFYPNLPNAQFALNIYTQFSKTYDKYIGIKYNNELFANNYNRNTQFKVNYCVQMLDENYLNIVYGEKGKSTQLPLRKTISSLLKSHSFFDIVSGNRSYLLTESNVNYDYYNAWVTVTGGTDLVLTNSFWEQYQMLHRSSLTDGYALAQRNNAINFLKGTVNALTQNTSDAQMVGMLNTSITYYQAEYNLKERLNILKNDLQATPDDLGNMSDIFPAYITKSIDNIFAVFAVNDIENCARYFEQYGYKVNKKFVDIVGKYASDIINNRLYYNYISINNINLSTLKFIPNDIIVDFKARLLAGVRFYKMNELQTDNKNMNTVLELDNADI